MSRQEVICFYSYKGGTGRTMSLANVACLIARNLADSERVLAIDWDLEAPGLSYYLPPAANSDSLSQHDGLIELFAELAEKLPSSSNDDEDKVADAVFDSLSIGRFVYETGLLKLDVMPAGRM